MLINQHNLFRIIDVPSWILTICMINENTILTGDNSGSISQ